MTTAPHMPAKAHSSDDVHHRPRGILKNSNSFQGASAPMAATSPLSVPTIFEPEETKELTIQNTLQNAGRRRSSSTTRPGSNSRRQSSASAHDENEPRLKWDEANLYLTEQEKTAKMKIDEPKTPYAPHYDPSEDDELMGLEDAQNSLIDAQGIVVDELDSAKPTQHRKAVSEDEIPDLELGEPEETLQDIPLGDARVFRDRSMSTDSHKSEKHVHVGVDDANGTHTPADDPLLTTEEARAKHAHFEQQRKRHYEMRNIKELLAHPEDLDEEMEDNDGSEPGPAPSMPHMPERFRNNGQ
ncbi:Protein phosphatase inhibitor 2 (IPP-2) [Penicillium coprophilum]|uniref:Protein phosphatase inhibitor 2 (IPP-2) n=1 Tax=Penicillium coprophilum TaxID=36646 RepID=UPI00239423AA|nr:Protein phosphatase inhibitor 2 (IPP-2) [Penicillium coprophilum]KAJ5165249.1 Protein phosphatase inhibitor 2 (IPP-2) [Penicillium coprophilum]